MQLHQTKFWEDPSLDRLLWILWGLNYFSSWAVSNFWPQICQVSLGFPCVGLSLSMSGIALEKLFLPVQCLFYFLPSSDNAARLPFLVKGLKITSFSLFFSPKNCLQALWEFTAQQTNKKVHGISCHSCLTLSALVERIGNLTQQLAGKWITSSFTNTHLSVTAIILWFYTP